jgi:multiple sugar transport system permease protein
VLAKGVKSRTINRIALYIFLFVCSILIVFPLFWMLSVALKTDEEAIMYPPRVLPTRLYFDHFKTILKDAVFMRFFLNSFIVAGVATVLSTTSSALAGFIFAKFRFIGRQFLFYALLITIMIPFQTYMVPLYLLALKFKVLNSYVGLIFPFIVSSFGIFFMRQNMQSIPDSLLDAAKIDGASNLKLFRLIAIPLSVSSMSVLAIFQFLTTWSEFIWPLLITNRKKLYVLELGLSLFQNEYYVNYGLLMAGATLAIIPVFVVYLVLRRYILEGIHLTGLKM